MLIIEFDLGKVKLCFENFDLHNIEEQTVKARQEIYQKLFAGVLAQIENLIDKNIKCRCGSPYQKITKKEMLTLPNSFLTELLTYTKISYRHFCEQY
jgi:hypothetical protein